MGNYKGLVPPLTKQSLENGITSIKVFTTYSESNRKCPIDVIESLLTSPLTILSHSEEDSLVISDWNTISDYESSRPVSSELNEIEELSQIAKKTNGNLYIVHTTCGSTLEMLQEKYSDILYKNIMIESCPQYFYLTKDYFKKENGYLYLLAPPLRSKKEQTKLKENIDNIYSIGTDHCPFMKSEKEKYPLASKVPKGLGSIEYSFLLMHNLFGDKIIEKMSKNPAKAFHLKNKGEIKVGKDADLFILNPNNKTTITSGHSKSDYSPYEGIKLNGEIVSTISRGEFVIKEQQLIKHKGMFIRRNLKWKQ